MLRLLRSGGASQIVVGAIVFAIIIAFALSFQGSGEVASDLTVKCSVEVKGECVSLKDYYAAYALVVPRGLSGKKIRQLELRKHVLNGLVERELLVREAKRLGLAIDDKEIDDELARGRAHFSLPVGSVDQLAIAMYGFQGGPQHAAMQQMFTILPVFDKDEKFDYEIYDRVVRSFTNRSPKEFKEMQERELLAARMRQLAAARVRVSDGEGWLMYERKESKAVARVAQIRRDWFATHVVDPSDDAVDTWAAQNVEQVDSAWEKQKGNWTAGCSLVREIKGGFAPGSTDEDKKGIRDRLEQAAQMVKDGASFATAAASKGDEAKAGLPGEIFCLGKSYGEGHEALSAAATKLQKGKVSGVIETTVGFHLLKSEGKLAEGDVEKFGRRETARRLYARFRADELAKEFAKKLIERAKAGTDITTVTAELAKSYAERRGKAKEGEELPALSDPDAPDVEVTDPFNRDAAPIGNLLPGEKPVHAAAIAFELKAGATHPEPLVTTDGVAVLQLKEKSVAERKDYDAEKEDFVARLLGAKQQDAVAEYVERLREAAKDEIKLNAELLAADKKKDDDES